MSKKERCTESKKSQTNISIFFFQTNKISKGEQSECSLPYSKGNKILCVREIRSFSNITFTENNLHNDAFGTSRIFFKVNAS